MGRLKTDGPDSEGHLHLQRLATLGTLAASSAHEVNNIVTQLLASLRSLGLAVDRLPPGGDDAACKQKLDAALDTSLQCGQRLRTLARGMTSSAASPSEELVLLQITDTLDQAIDLVSPELRQHAVVQRDYDVALPPLRANEGKLCQVFVNLLVNAMHAVASNGNGSNDRVCVTARLTDEWICVDVRDTGPGIPCDAMDRIFDRFFTTKPPEIGTGLGLAVSRDIIDELGGEIRVSSTPGQGAVFSVVLPRA